MWMLACTSQWSIGIQWAGVMPTLRITFLSYKVLILVIFLQGFLTYSVICLLHCMQNRIHLNMFLVTPFVGEGQKEGKFMEWKYLTIRRDSMLFHFKVLLLPFMKAIPSVGYDMSKNMIHLCYKYVAIVLSVINPWKTLYLQRKKKRVRRVGLKLETGNICFICCFNFGQKQRIR